MCISYQFLIAYDLNTFKPTEYTRSSLDLTPRIDGAYTKNSKSQRDNTDYTYSIEADVAYGFDQNLLHRVIQSTFELSAIWYSNYYETNVPSDWRYTSSIDDDYRFTITAYSSGTYRLYTHSPLYGVIHQNINVRYHLFDLYDSNTPADTLEQIKVYRYDGTTLNYGGVLGLGLGYGRIDEISTASHARFIIDDLKKSALLIRPVSDVDIAELGQLVLQQHYRRVFEVRIDKKKRLVQLDSLLKSRGLIDTTSGELAAVLNDYVYLQYNTRKTGSLFEAYALGGVDLSDNSDNTDSSDSLSYEYETGYYGVLHHSYHRALNASWQFNWLHTYYLGRFYYGYSHHLNDDLQDQLFGWQSAYRTDITLAYYPTTRTILAQLMRLEYSYTQGEVAGWGVGETTAFNTHNLALMLQSSATWYVSERLDITGRIGLHYDAVFLSPEEALLDSDVYGIVSEYRSIVPLGKSALRIHTEEIDYVNLSASLTLNYSLF